MTIDTSTAAGVLALARKICAVLIEKKGIDVRLYNVTGESPITDYYINATGRSQNNVAALSNYVEDELAKLDISALRVEGRSGGAWVLVDFGDVIVNVFDKESRSLYNLDRLMPGGSELDISDIVKEVDEKLNAKRGQ